MHREKLMDGQTTMEEKASNGCCAELNKKHTKLLEKYKKVEDIKNKLRDCLDMVRQRYDSIEKENQNLKKDLDEFKMNADLWKQEKEKETRICADLQTQVLALNDEIQCLKQNNHSGSQEATQKLQEKLIIAEKHIKDLKVLLNEEREKASLEKKNAELEKRKADEAVKKAEREIKRACDAQKLANTQRKKNEESEYMLKNLKMEMDSLRSMLDLEKKKADKALKQAQIGKNMVAEAQMIAEIEKKKADENTLALEKLKKEIGSVKSLMALEKSKSEALVKSAGQEKEKARREKERADLDVANAKALENAAEFNLKKATFERDRAEDLNRKLEEALAKGKCTCFKRCPETQADGSSNAGITVCGNNAYGDALKSDSSASHLVDAVFLGKENNTIGARKHGSEKKKHNKLISDKVDNKKLRVKKKHRVGQLTEDAEIYSLRPKELQELQEYFSFNSPPTCKVFSETDTLKLLRKQLKLEKMLVRHAKKTSKLEALRSHMLHRKVLNITQEYLVLQQRVTMLERSTFNSGKDIPPSVKIGAGSCSRGTITDAGCQSHAFSGTDSRLEPTHRGSSKKILHPSPVNSSSAFFSEPKFMGSQDRDTLFVSSSAIIGHGTSNLKQGLPKLSDRRQHECSENEHHRSDGCRNSSLHDNELVSKSSSKRNSVIDDVGSVKDLCSEAERLHKCTSEKQALLHGVLDAKQENLGLGNSKRMSCREYPKSLKRRKTSSGGLCVTDGPEDFVVRKRQFSRSGDHLLPSAPPRSPMTRLKQCLQDCKNKTFYSHHHATDDIEKMDTFDYMKLLDLDDDSEENSYRSAIAIPVSPSLPLLHFDRDENLDVGNDEIYVNDNCPEGLEIVPGKLPSISSCDIGDPIPLKELQNKGNFDCSKKLNLVMKEDSSLCISPEVVDQEVADTYDSEEKEISRQPEKENATSRGAVFKHFIVVLDNKNHSSILRILQTVSGCKDHCSFLHSADTFFQRILQALLNAENISMREKVCVFLSLFLRGVNEVWQKNLLSTSADDFVQSLDMVSGKIYSDPLLGRMFMESIDFHEFHGVLEDFILHGKLLVYDDVPQLRAPSIPKVNVVLNQDALTLYEVVASSHLLISSGNLLATVCLAIGQIGFICEMACNILIWFKSAPAVLLAILHVFARVCGPSLFTHQQFSISIEVVKSITTVLEEPCKSLYCSGNCPFSENAISMENVALMLLESFQKHITSWAGHSLKLDNLAMRHTLGSSENAEDATCLGVADEDFVDTVDLLSLIEIVASFMEWRWTVCHIIVPLCEQLDSHLSNGRYAVSILLLSQLGRMGVDACGYEDNGVKKLQQRLCAFVAEPCFNKLSLFHQFATVDSLLGLTPVDLTDILEDGRFDAPADLGSHNPCKLIRQWFSQLQDEQQSLFRRRPKSGFPFGCKVGV